MIDLKPFCGTEETRYYLMEPVTRGDFTYATDGHVIVRVPRRDEYADVEKAPDFEKLFRQVTATIFRPVAKVVLPPGGKCVTCAGRGTVHDCPDCVCDCEGCQGKGDLDRERSLSIAGTMVGLGYARLLLQLPSLSIADAIDVKTGRAIPFRFSDGGDGLLMSRAKPAADHLDIDLAPITEGATP